MKQRRYCVRFGTLHRIREIANVGSDIHGRMLAVVHIKGGSTVVPLMSIQPTQKEAWDWYNNNHKEG
jgi:hypothetical protein